MPIKGWDHLELYVGNAKQCAYFYERAFGFTQTAYAGPETGVRPRVLRPRPERHPARRHERAPAGQRDHEVRLRHGDGVKDVALAVPDATEAYRQAVQRARSVTEPTGSRTTTAGSSWPRSRPTATTSTLS